LRQYLALRAGLSISIILLPHVDVAGHPHSASEYHGVMSAVQVHDQILCLAHCFIAVSLGAQKYSAIPPGAG
jgi:hypothetical protein